MKQALLLNDVHIGVKRSAGTTPFSAQALQAYIQASFSAAIHSHLDKHLVINGDLFDGFEIDTSELIKTYETLADWCRDSDQDAQLILIAGNHDISARAGKVSSFELLCRILRQSFGGSKVVTVFQGELTHLFGSVWSIPHCNNQSLFDLECEKALERVNGPAKLLLHCNYDNKFAVESDNSLNLSEERAQLFKAKGITLVFAHEHQARTALGGSAVICGNQWPSSIADCLGNTSKHAHIIDEDGALIPLETWSAKNSYKEVDWTEAGSLAGDWEFIRVTGTSTLESSAEALDAVAQLRQRSKAYVVSNAVKIEGMQEMESLTSLSFDSISKFSVLDALLEELSAEEAQTVKSLLEDTPCGKD